MLIWLNGPFGGGKTQTAYEMQRRLAGSVVCDPEEVGFGLHRMMPRRMRGDFQDLAAWRIGVRDVLRRVLDRHPGVVIAPMTVVEPAYLDEIVGPLRAYGHEVRHFSLLARRETVVRRLRERGFGRAMRVLGGADAPLRLESFAMGRLDVCLERLVRPAFREQLWTDELPVAAVAERVAELTGVRLAPNTDGALRGRVRRAVVGARHIRFD